MKTYIGDGIYAELNHGVLILTTENGITTTNMIVFEQREWDALNKWLQQPRDWNAAHASDVICPDCGHKYQSDKTKSGYTQCPKCKADRYISADALYESRNLVTRECFRLCIKAAIEKALSGQRIYGEWGTAVVIDDEFSGVKGRAHASEPVFESPKHFDEDGTFHDATDDHETD